MLGLVSNTRSITELSSIPLSRISSPCSDTYSLMWSPGFKEKPRKKEAKQERSYLVCTQFSQTLAFLRQMLKADSLGLVVKLILFLQEHLGGV